MNSTTQLVKTQMIFLREYKSLYSKDQYNFIQQQGLAEQKNILSWYVVPQEEGEKLFLTRIFKEQMDLEPPQKYQQRDKRDMKALRITQRIYEIMGAYFVLSRSTRSCKAPESPHASHTADLTSASDGSRSPSFPTSYISNERLTGDTN